MNNLIQKAGLSTISLLIFTTVILVGFLLFGQDAEAQYGSCSEYGVMAYESGGYCKCMAGYIMGEGVLGGSYCISEDQACKDQYGYNARSSYTGGCECRSGYVFDTNMFGDKQCVSADSVCKDELGVMSRYNSLSDSCECSYGYVIDGGRCVDGDQVCHSDHGYHSSYDNLSNSCECDYDYTFDDNYQCVEKQHNVYFKLLDINPKNDKELLIKSDYDSRRYIVKVGVGCLSTSISRYESKNLVVNLGTDYEVDMFDTVVLQDHDQTCSIMHRERTYDDSFPEPVEETYYYTPPAQTYTPTSITPEPSYNPEPAFSESDDTLPPEIKDAAVNTEISLETETQIDDEKVEATSKSTTTDQSEDIQTEVTEVKESLFTKIINFFRGWF